MIRPHAITSCLAMAVFLLHTPRSARAQYGGTEGLPEFSLSMGYANIDLHSSAPSPISSEGAFHIDSFVSFAPIQPVPQLRLGADLGASFVLDNSTRTIISNGGGLIIAGSSDVPLWLFEPELRLSWRQTFGQSPYFIEPGIAGGFAFGYLDLKDLNTGISYHADSTTGYGRVFLRAGAGVSGGIAGIETSYLAGGRLNFGGNAVGELREFYIGVFGALSF